MELEELKLTIGAIEADVSAKLASMTSIDSLRGFETDVVGKKGSLGSPTRIMGDTKSSSNGVGHAIPGHSM